MEQKENTFSKLYKIDVSSKIGKKMGLSYLSWSDAWAELKKAYPDASYKIYTRLVKTSTVVTAKDGDTTTVTTSETENEIPYFTDGSTCFVKVGVTVLGVEEIEIYPVMDLKNNAVRLSMITSTVVNKALQRAFVKACARHGLALYIYSGEDLPEDKRINMANLIKEANRMKTSDDLSAAEFDRMKNGVIEYIKSQGDDLDPTYFQFVQSLFPNKKVTVITAAEDSANLQKLFFVTQKLVA